MINKLWIENFQSHKKTHLELHPGVNIIVGSSDSGKSAIIRALRWLIYGVPRGEGIRSHWGGDTVVKIETPEFPSISRLRSNTQNQYKLTPTNKHPIEFNAIGAEVPEEVQVAFNMDAVNIQHQIDSPYLFSETPGNVAAHFNKVANLEKIDSTLKAIQSDLRAQEQTLKQKEKDVIDLQTQLDEYNYIEEAETLVTAVEELEQKGKRLKKQYDDLIGLAASLQDNMIKQDSYITLTAAMPELVKAEGLYKRFIDTDKEAGKLHSILTRQASNALVIQASEKTIKALPTLIAAEAKYVTVIDIFKQKRALTSIISTVEKTQQGIEIHKEVIKAEKKIDEITELFFILQEKKRQQQTLYDSIWKFNGVIVQKTKAEKSLKETENKYNELWEQEKTCPMCLRPL